MDRKLFARLKKKIGLLYPERPLIGFNVGFNHTGRVKDFNPERGFTVYPILGSKPCWFWPLAQMEFDGDFNKFGKKLEELVDLDIAKLQAKIKEVTDGTV